MIEFGWIVPMFVYALWIALGGDPHEYLAAFLIAESASAGAFAWEMHVRWRDREGRR